MELLHTLRALGVRLEARGDTLHVEAPKGVLTDARLASLRAHKAGLLAALRPAVSDQLPGGTAETPRDGRGAERAAGLLASVPDPDRRADLRELFDERAGIVEYDGRLPRDEAERAAFLELQTAMQATDAGAGDPARLAELTKAVTGGEAAACTVLDALETIRERRLFRGTHPSFEAYCRERWGVEPRAYEAMRSAFVTCRAAGEIPQRPKESA
ncbi:MAG: hypothetical protein HY763_14590 [Planctomycetes bacterium]|nr:hypothetical protein [Planctomycetota bacterium]